MLTLSLKAVVSESLAGRDLAWLERRRTELFGLMSQVGDFRRGALNAVWRKCGKPGCARGRGTAGMGEGAAWIWTLAGALYPHATHITDIYHAREHLTDLAAHQAFITPDPAQWLADRNAELDAGDIHAIITAARQYPLTGVKAEERDKKLGYFERNAHWMHYQHFRELGMFTGSGAIEGGIKAIAVQRAKQAGMHWTTAGAADIIALRCQHASGRWNELWPARAASPPGLRAAV